MNHRGPAADNVQLPVRPISVSQVVKDIAGRQPFQAVRDLDSTYMSGATFGSPSFPPFCGFVQRESLKRKAQDISRSESDVFSFLTQNTTSQEQAKQLLDIITKVSSSLIESHHYCNYLIIVVIVHILIIVIIVIIWLLCIF